MSKPTTSPKKAIANHCKGCTYDSQDKGNWLQQVEACTITSCDLYEHRPLTHKTRRLRNENHLASLTQAERDIVQLRQGMFRERMLNARNPEMVNHESL